MCEFVEASADLHRDLVALRRSDQQCRCFAQMTIAQLFDQLERNEQLTRRRLVRDLEQDVSRATKCGHDNNRPARGLATNDAHHAIDGVSILD